MGGCTPELANIVAYVIGIAGVILGLVGQYYLGESYGKRTFHEAFMKLSIFEKFLTQLFKPFIASQVIWLYGITAKPIWRWGSLGLSGAVLFFAILSIIFSTPTEYEEKGTYVWIIIGWGSFSLIFEFLCHKAMEVDTPIGKADELEAF